MAKLAQERGVAILAYGTVMGGLLSEKWLGKPEPNPRFFETVSQQKVGGEREGEGWYLVLDTGHWKWCGMDDWN